MSTTDVSPTTVPPEPPPGLFANSAHRFSVEDYHRMNDVGLLDNDNKMELLEGYLVPKMNQRPIHSATVCFVEKAIWNKLSSRWHVRTQLPITVDHSEPEPDVAVVTGTISDYITQHPQLGQIAMVIEVAETSLERDREKRRIYARASISVYWIVNLIDFCVEVYTNPDNSHTSPCYSTHRNYSREEQLPLVIDGKEIALIDVTDVLPEVK